MKLSEHFDSSEFQCPCGCGGNKIDQRLVNMLEALFRLMDAKVIIVTSGYRCPTHSIRVGGSKDDAHTIGYAADIKVQKQDGSWYTAEDIAEAAERLDFGGIGLMDGACHVDIRHLGGYKNTFWHGDERNGRDFINSFQRGTKFTGSAAIDHLLKIYIDDNLIIEMKLSELNS